MALTITDPEAERWLLAEAARTGQSVDDVLIKVLKEELVKVEQRREERICQSP